MNDLDKLAIKYGADKWGKHHYTPVYYDLFKDRRNEVKNVLEIGVAEWASLFMWLEFFPNATIYGADIDRNRVMNLLGEERDRIKVFECDQSKGNDLRVIIGTIGFDIDLVIDDGSHKPSDQVFSCLTILDWLLKDFIYVIEDVGEVDIAGTLRNYMANFDVQTVNCGKRYDDQLVIVRKKK
jgi:hypothetical protein